MSLHDLWQVSDIETRSLSPENPDGKKGGGAKAKSTPDLPCSELGDGWKVRPFITIEPSQIITIGDVKGEGMIKHIWCTSVLFNEAVYPTSRTCGWRDIIIRFYWDDSKIPSIECPIGDFFACGWGEYAHVNSLAVCVNPGSAFNCYWEMPFKKNFKITIENRSKFTSTLYYQIDYELKKLPKDIMYLHAQFNRVNPLPENTTFEILDKKIGKGAYVGTYMCWSSNSRGWWGEGEIKFYIDGDSSHPTICGTGTEDYFCGSYDFENQKTHEYEEFTTAYAGLPQVLRPDRLYKSQMRFGMYRWHIQDPVYFNKDLRVDIQAIGWDIYGKFVTLHDDISAVAFWYQDKPGVLKPLQSPKELGHF